jgi:hypothetical protein
MNMSPRSDVHARFTRADGRIPPLACYVHEETLPYLPDKLIVFHLRKDVLVPDLSGNASGAAGGDNARGWVLRAIEYPAPTMDTSDGKIQGGRRSALVDEGPDSDDSCATDSGEDVEGSDEHKVIQIAQAIHKAQPVTIAIRGQLKGFQEEEVEILFQRDHEGPPPTDLREPWALAMSKIVGLSSFYGTEGLPNALLWAETDTPREHMDVTVAKLGKGVVMTFAQKGYSGRSISTLPASYIVPLVEGWQVSFGAQQAPADMEPTQCLADATAPWNPTLRVYGRPWVIYLTPAMWRAGPQGEIMLTPLPDCPPGKAPLAPNQHVPWVTAPPRTFIEANRPKKIQAMLRFGRDSGWPLRVTMASVLDEYSSMSATYALEWDGLE